MIHNLDNARFPLARMMSALIASQTIITAIAALSQIQLGLSHHVKPMLFASAVTLAAAIASLRIIAQRASRPDGIATGFAIGFVVRAAIGLTAAAAFAYTYPQLARQTALYLAGFYLFTLSIEVALLIRHLNAADAELNADREPTTR